MKVPYVIFQGLVFATSVICLVGALLLSEKFDSLMQSKEGASSIQSWNETIEPWIGQDFTEQKKEYLVNRMELIIRGDSDVFSSVSTLFRASKSIFIALIFFQSMSFLFLAFRPKGHIQSELDNA